jgi:hypothetical protein
LTFNKLFSICDEVDISVANCADRDWQIGFRRMLGSEEYDEWRELQQLLLPVVLSDTEDSVAWGLSPTRTFTTSYLYRFLVSEDVSSGLAKKIVEMQNPFVGQDFPVAGVPRSHSDDTAAEAQGLEGE